MPILIKQGSVTVRIYPTRTELNGKVYKAFSVRWSFKGQKYRVKKSIKADAIAFAESKAVMLSNGQGAALALTESDAATYTAANQLIAPLGKSLLVCLEEYVEAAKLAPVLPAARYYHKHHASGPRLMFGEIVKRFNSDKAVDGTRWRHRRDLKSRLTILAEAIKMPLVSLTARDAKAVLDALQKKEELSNRTRNHYRAALLNLGNYAIRQGYVPRDWTELQHLERVQERDGQVTIYTPDQLAQFLGATNDCHLPAVICAFFAGIRTTEIQGDKKDGLRPLDWSDINWRTGEVFIAEGKVRTAGQRFAMLSKNALAWLKPLRKESGPLCSTTVLSHELVTIAKRAGLKWHPDIHRHSYISHRIARTKDIAKVSEEVGTDAKTLRKKYRRPLPAQQAKRYFSIWPKEATAGKVIQLSDLKASQKGTKRGPKIPGHLKNASAAPASEVHKPLANAI